MFVWYVEAGALFLLRQTWYSYHALFMNEWMRMVINGIILYCYNKTYYHASSMMYNRGYYNHPISLSQLSRKQIYIKITLGRKKIKVSQTIFYLKVGTTMSKQSLLSSVLGIWYSSQEEEEEEEKPIRFFLFIAVLRHGPILGEDKTTGLWHELRLKIWIK